MRVKFLVMCVFMLLCSGFFSQVCAISVKSKKGSINLYKQKGGDQFVCTADFKDELKLLRKDGDYVLVKAPCGQGWVATSDVEYIPQAAGDKSMKLDNPDVVGWLDNPAAVFVLDNDGADFEGINMDRDFREYLKHTMDRESIERKNGDN